MVSTFSTKNLIRSDSVLRDETEIEKKSPVPKMSRTFILHNNNAGNILKN